MRLIVDTNAWLRCASLRIDLWEEAKRVIPGKLELCTIDRVVHELQGLKSQGGILARESALAMNLLHAKPVTILPSSMSGSVDDSILSVAKEPDFVLTQDKELKSRLKAKHIGVVVIRGEDHLELENKT